MTGGVAVRSAAEHDIKDAAIGEDQIPQIWPEVGAIQYLLSESARDNPHDRPFPYGATPISMRRRLQQIQQLLA